MGHLYFCDSAQEGFVSVVLLGNGNNASRDTLNFKQRVITAFEAATAWMKRLQSFSKADKGGSAISTYTDHPAKVTLGSTAAPAH